MSDNNDKKFFWYIGPAALVTLSVLALIIMLLKPPQISKELLESVDFKESVTERVKRLTGLDISYESLQATADLHFSMKNVEITKVVQGRQLHSCQSPQLSGQFANEGQLFTLTSLRVESLNCELTVGTDFQPLGLHEGVSPGLSDFDLLFGVSLANTSISRLNLTAHRVDNSGARIDTVGLQNAKLDLDLAVSVSKQTAGVKLSAGPQGLGFFHRDGQTQANAVSEGLLSLQYDSGTGLNGNVDFKLREQNFVPNYASGDFPAQLSFGLHGEGRIPEKLQLKDFLFQIQGVAQARARETEIAFASSGEEMRFAFRGVEAESMPALSSLLALPPETVSNAAARLQNAQVEGTFRFNGHVPEVNAKGSVESVVVSTSQGGPFSLERLEHSIRTVRSPASTNQRPIVDVTLDMNAAGAEYPATAYSAHDLKLFSQFSVEGNDKLVLRTATFSSSGHATEASLTGSLGWVDGLPQNINVSGSVAQELKVTLLDEYHLNGRARIPFELRTSPTGSVQLEATLNATADQLNHDSFTAENVSFNAPIRVSLHEGLPNDFLFTGVKGQVLDDLTRAISSWSARLTASAARVEVIQEHAQSPNNIVVENLTARGFYKQTGWTVGRTDSDGSISIGQYRAPSPDGSEVLTFQNPIELGWIFHPVDESTPGAIVTVDLHNKELRQKAQAQAKIYPNNRNGLSIEYQSKSNLFNHLAHTLGLYSEAKFKDLQVDGKIELEDFFAMQQSLDWNLMLVNLPYEGRVRGTATARAREVWIDSIENTQALRFTGPVVTLSHEGDTTRQRLTMKGRAMEIDLDMVNGHSYTARNIEVDSKGELSLPFPAADLPFNAKVTSAKVFSNHERVLDIPNTDLFVEGNLRNGTSLEISHAYGKLGGQSVAQFRGSIDSFHPLAGVDFTGEFTPYLPAFPADRVAAKLGPKSQARIPFRIASTSNNQLVAKGRLELDGVSFQTEEKVVSDVKASLPFAFVLSVDDENSLVLEVGREHYRSLGLDKKGTVRARAEKLPRYVVDGRQGKVSPLETRLNLQGNRLSFDAVMNGNRIHLRSRAEPLALKGPEGSKKHTEAELIFDERGMILKLGNEEYVVADPVIDHTY